MPPLWGDYAPPRSSSPVPRSTSSPRTLLGTADASGHLGRFMQPVIDQARQLITEALHDRTEPLTQDGRNLDPITAANQALEALNAILARLG